MPEATRITDDEMLRTMMVTRRELVEGKMYCHLFHGRHHPGEELEDWGFDGPMFGPLLAFHQTYHSTWQLVAEQNETPLFLEPKDDLFEFEGKYYADLVVFLHTESEAARHG